MNKPVHEKFGPLDCMHIPGQPDAEHIVFVHGYGADCNDLVPLAREIGQLNNANWYFPNGPLVLDMGFGMMGRAWFPIDVEALAASQSSADYRDRSNIRPEGIDQASNQLREFISAIGSRPENLIMGGFSQGAMMATDVTLQMPVSPAALVLLSATLLDAQSWSALASKHAGLAFIQSHGDSDPLLDPGAAYQLYQLLTAAGLKGKLHTFAGGHEIPKSVLVNLQKFLKEIVNKNKVN